MKNIQNALLTKYFDVKKEESEREFADWDHITIAFEIEMYARKEHAINHITNEHIYADKIRKMSVKHAVHVFGGRFGDFVEKL